MTGRELVGKSALVCYTESGRSIQCYGTISSVDEHFLGIQTEGNLLIIPHQRIEKVKIRGAEE